jgi:hypothetical protein
VLLFLFAVIVIYFSEKKRETEFLLAAVLFIYGSGTVQNRYVGGIRYWSFGSSRKTMF